MAFQSPGPVGVCLPVSFTTAPQADLQRVAVRRLRDAGYQAIWTNEVVGKDAFVQLGVLLAATERTVFAPLLPISGPDRRRPCMPRPPNSPRRIPAGLR